MAESVLGTSSLVVSLPEAALSLPKALPAKRRTVPEAAIGTALIAVLCLFLLLIIALPLGTLLIKSLEAPDGGMAGLSNFRTYFATPTLVDALLNSLTVAGIVVALVVPLAFGYAYALTRTAMPFKALFLALALLPLFAPSLLSGIALTYILGNQGFLRGLLFGHSVYGPIGITLAECLYAFPHALIILVTALGLSDGRLYEAASAMGTSRLRTFVTVTLPGARYGLVSAAFVVFTLVVTDFGIPKVIGGQYPVLATERLPPGSRPAELPHGRRGRPPDAGAGGAGLHRRPAHPATAIVPALGPLRTLRAEAPSGPRPPRPGLRHARGRRDRGHLRGRGLGLVHPLLALQPRPDPGPLRLRGGRFRWLVALLELARHGALGRGHRHDDGVLRGLPHREAEAVSRRSGLRAVAGDAAARGAGPRARPRLRVLLQRALEPAERPLRDPGAPRDQHAGALLHGRPRHGDDGPEADRPGIRGGVGLPEGTVLADLPPGQPADLPADRARTVRLPVRQRHDDGLGGDLPLRAEHQARRHSPSSTWTRPAPRPPPPQWRA